jgi:two-component system, OmpR family, response regulator
MTQKRNHVLVVDRDGDVRATIAELLLDLGHRVSLAKDGDAMRAFIEAGDKVQLIVLDASASDAEEITLGIQARDHGIRLIMISGHPDMMERYQDRADQLLWKPFGRAELERAVDHALVSEIAGQREADPSSTASPL